VLSLLVATVLAQSTNGSAVVVCGTTGVDAERARELAAEVEGALRAEGLTISVSTSEVSNRTRDLPECGAQRDCVAQRGQVLGVVAATPHKIYLLIDEYDHFANRLLSSGSGLYDTAIAAHTGFVRTFYAQLKAGTQPGTLSRMFITGVTPLMLDDLSSGFNIARQITQSPRFNALAGFTHEDVERAIDVFLAARPELARLPEIGDRRRLLDVLEAHYDGYRFSADASARVFNPDMVLYFLQELSDRGKYPEDMLDMNVRTEYRHLQRIGTITGADADERRALLETILSEGHIRTPLLKQFGRASLQSSPASFLSLLYYLGMLTLRDVPQDVIGYDLEIPNRVIRELQWEHLAQMLEETVHLAANLDTLQAALGAMATDGDIAPFLAVFHEHVLKAFSVRDTRQLGEKTIKLLLMTYASLGRAFHPLTEKEFAQGYCDLFLGASPRVSGARYSWLLELKVVKTGATPAGIEAAFAEAEQQVARYAADRALLPLLVGDRALKAGMLVFVGTKKVLFRPWPALPAPSGRKKRAAGPRSAA